MVYTNIYYLILTILHWHFCFEIDQSYHILQTNKFGTYYKWINFGIFHKGKYDIRLDTFSYGKHEFTPSFYWGWVYSILKLRSSTLWTIFCLFSFLFWPLHCLFLDLQFLIISLVSLFLLFCFNSSSLQFSVFIQL